MNQCPKCGRLVPPPSSWGHCSECELELLLAGYDWSFALSRVTPQLHHLLGNLQVEGVIDRLWIDLSKRTLYVTLPDASEQRRAELAGMIRETISGAGCMSFE